MVSAQKSKGAIQLVPLLILALIVVGVTSFKANEKKQQTQEKVLSKGSNEDEGGENKDSSGSSSGGSGSSSTITTSVSSTPKSVARKETTPKIEEEKETGKENEVETENETENEAKNEFTKIRAEENKTRLERVFFENGVKKKVELRNENGRVRVRVKTETAEGVETSQTLDLRPEDGKVTLKIEENGVEKSVTVKSLADRFVIEQEGFEVPTSFPITVDTVTNTITVETPAGVVNVRELPAQAIQNLLAANVLDEVENTELGEPEEEGGTEQVVYKVEGIQKAKLLGIFNVDAPILAEVSAATGEQTFVSEPWYLRAFGFLFSK